MKVKRISVLHVDVFSLFSLLQGAATLHIKMQICVFTI